MQRKQFTRDGVTLSYLDQSGSAVPVIALHAYWMEAGTYADFATRLAPPYRVIALDQRGHGHSDKPDDLSWDAFIGDLDGLLGHLGFSRDILLVGNSLGGTVAFRYAARRPDAVKGMIIEESPAVEDADLGFMRAWEGTILRKRHWLPRMENAWRGHWSRSFARRLRVGPWCSPRTS